MAIAEGCAPHLSPMRLAGQGVTGLGHAAVAPSLHLITAESIPSPFSQARKVHTQLSPSCPVCATLLVSSFLSHSSPRHLPSPPLYTTTSLSIPRLLLTFVWRRIVAPERCARNSAAGSQPCYPQSANQRAWLSARSHSNKHSLHPRSLHHPPPTQPHHRRNRPCCKAVLCRQHPGLSHPSRRAVVDESA
ncbi:hypothetical protein BDY17DRAFT_173194 [Neohortaea acidophila]|uniref:Uncharacterized protein n=1 Tax=Neohortaea acidophila TaxID=245834 RepID=A0A6A6PR09_9PEZI|nr:uncharacterized protein BDY17DRAFT_173194 [Neohortaea acidophila]KAF2481883.1 hypothetical protein BDY17DRAFT_173194 [Neohortaea acidophila]